MFRLKAFYHVYAQRFQLGAHRRINFGVATRDFKTCFFGDGGNATHESTGYAYDVDVLHLLQTRINKMMPMIVYIALAGNVSLHPQV